MPTFSSKPIGRKSSPAWSAVSKLTPQVRKHPVLFFGLPFIMTIVAGSYGLSQLTQTRYDYNATKVQSLSKEEELGMKKNRRKIDLREEYYRLQAKDSELDEWEPKRIARPAGVPEWGVPPTSSSDNRIHNEEVGPDQQDLIKPLGTSSRSGRPDVVLGPDGKPCRACNSKLAFSAAMRGSSNKGQGSTSTIVQPSPSLSRQDSQCPPDGEAIGHSTWTLLHSAAAYYPSQPSSTQQSSMLALVQSLPHLYPCHSCADALQEELKREEQAKRSWEGGKVLKEAIRSGPGLRKWLCGLHNEVNERLGKPLWKCEEGALQTRWLDGPDDGSCD